MADILTTQPATLSDRRRPDRADVHPSLLPLLRQARGEPTADTHPDDGATAGALSYADEAGADDLAPARGIALAAAVSLVMWGALYAAASFAWFGL